jgi:hypothetical protein
MAKARIDYTEAERLLRQGLSQAEVAARFGVHQPAIAVAIARGRIRHDSGYQRWLPKQWKISRSHTNRSLPRKLRMALRLQAGEHLEPKYRDQAEGFIRKLHELDAVIHFDPEVEPYFFRVRRRPGIDEGLIRNPNVP